MVTELIPFLLLIRLVSASDKVTSIFNSQSSSSASSSSAAPSASLSETSALVGTSSRRIGAIVGGTLGGVIVLGAIIAIAVIYRTRRLRERQAARPSGDDGKSAFTNDEHTVSSQVAHSPVTTPNLVLYNPYDPKTFPPPLSSTPIASSSGSNHDSFGLRTASHTSLVMPVSKASTLPQI